MTADFMFWSDAAGRPMTYGSGTDGHKVPRKTYRCPSTARDLSKKAHTHLCKLVVDHDGAHLAIGGKSWERVA